MSVLVNRSTRVMVQGLGNEGQNQIRRSLDYGTNVVAGVHPSFPRRQEVRELSRLRHRRGGRRQDQAQRRHHLRARPRRRRRHPGERRCRDPADHLHHRGRARAGHGPGQSGAGRQQEPPHRAQLPRPESPPPPSAAVGIMPPAVFMPGRVGVVSRSGTLVYEAVDQLTRLGIGQSSCVGVGGDPIIGTSQVEALEDVQQRQRHRRRGADR